MSTVSEPALIPDLPAAAFAAWRSEKSNAISAVFYLTRTVGCLDLAMEAAWQSQADHYEASALAEAAYRGSR